MTFANLPAGVVALKLIAMNQGTEYALIIGVCSLLFWIIRMRKVRVRDEKEGAETMRYFARMNPDEDAAVFGEGNDVTECVSPLAIMSPARRLPSYRTCNGRRLRFDADDHRHIRRWRHNNFGANCF